jgi:lactate dehydrogenase-like 2-hydroxyacid dehydrogenase
VAQMKENKIIKQRSHREPEKSLEDYISGGDKTFTINEIYQKIIRDFPDVLNVSDVSAILRSSTKLTYKLLNEGKLKSLKSGRSFIIPKHYLLQYLDAVN